VARALATRGVDSPVDGALGRFREIYDRRLLLHTRPYEGLVEAVRAISSRASLAVLTNKPEGPARRLLEAFDLGDRFRWVIGGDGPLPRKPDPSGLQHLMAQAAESTDGTLLVGDSAIDVETARRAGVRLCLARYGFGALRGGIVVDASDLVVDDPHDVASTIGRFLDERSRL